MGELSLFSLMPLPRSKSQIFTGEICTEGKDKAQLDRPQTSTTPHRHVKLPENQAPEGSPITFTHLAEKTEI